MAIVLPCLAATNAHRYSGSAFGTPSKTWLVGGFVCLGGGLLPQGRSVGVHKSKNGRAQSFGVIDTACSSCRSLKQAVEFHDRHEANQAANVKQRMMNIGQEVELSPSKAADINPTERLWGISIQRKYDI